MEGVILPNVKSNIYITSLIKTLWYWQKNRQIIEIEQGTQKQINTNIPKLILTKVQEQFDGGRIVFSVNGAGTIWTLHRQENKP